MMATAMIDSEGRMKIPRKVKDRLKLQTGSKVPLVIEDGSAMLSVAEIAFTLGTFFNMDPLFWINLQSRYDLRLVQLQQAKTIRARVRPLVA